MIVATKNRGHRNAQTSSPQKFNGIIIAMMCAMKNATMGIHHVVRKQLTTHRRYTNAVPSPDENSRKL